jgi:hypothetical protein
MGSAARPSWVGTTAGAAVAALALLTVTAGAAPAAVDLQLDIAIGQSAPTARVVPNGSTQTVTRLRFGAGVDLSLITNQSASAKVRLVLPDGLAWGTDAPDPTEDCTSTASIGECQTPVLEPIAGRNAVGWGLGDGGRHRCASAATAAPGVGGREGGCRQPLPREAEGGLDGRRLGSHDRRWQSDPATGRDVHRPEQRS